MRFVCLFILLVSLMSCQSVNVNVDYNKSVNFAGFRSFSWLNSVDQSDYVSLHKQQLHDSLMPILASKGLLYSEQNPDVLVAITFSEIEKVHYQPRHHFHVSYTSDPFYYPHHNYNDYNYIETRFVIALVDPKTKKSLWEAAVLQHNFTSLSQETIDKIMNAMFENYPPMPAVVP